MVTFRQDDKPGDSPKALGGSGQSGKPRMRRGFALAIVVVVASGDAQLFQPGKERLDNVGETPADGELRAEEERR